MTNRREAHSTFIAKRLLKVGAAALALVFSLFIAVNLVIGAFVLWLNTPPGQGWIHSQIATALRGSPYAVTFEGFYHRALQGVFIAGLEVRDDQGVLLQARRLGIDVDLSALLQKRLSIALSGDTIHIVRLPESRQDDEAVSSGLQAFPGERAYFERITLRDLNLRALSVSEDVAGQALKLDVKAQAQIMRTGNVFDIDAEAGFQNVLPESGQSFLPENLALKARFDSGSLDLGMEELSAKSPAYKVVGSGQANMNSPGTLSLQIKSDVPDFQALGAPAGRADLEWNVKGSVADPVVHAQGVVTLEALRTRGVESVRLDFTARDLGESPQGDFSLNAAFQDQPLQAQANWVLEGEVLGLSDAVFTGPDLSAKGLASIDLRTTTVDGALDVEARSLTRYADLFAINLKGAAKGRITASRGPERQQIDLDITATDLSYDTIRAQMASVQAGLVGPDYLWPRSLTLTVRDLRFADRPNIRIAELRSQIDAGLSADEYMLSLDTKGRISDQDLTATGTAQLSGLAEESPFLRDMALRLRSGEGRVDIKGSVMPSGVAIDVEAADIPAALFPVSSIPQALQKAMLGGKASVEGTMEKPDLRAEVNLITPLVPDQSTPTRLRADVRADALGLRGSFAAKGPGIQTFEGAFDSDALWSLQPVSFNISEDTKLNGQARGIFEAEALSSLLLPDGQALEGDLNLDARLGGRMGAPELEGMIALAGGQYKAGPQGFALHDIDLRASLAPDELRVEKLNATDRQQGRLAASGSVSWQDKQDTRLTASLENFAIASDVGGSGRLEGMMSANVTLAGQAAGYGLSGVIDSQRIQITIPERFGSTIPALNIITPATEKQDAPSQIFLDLALRAPNQVFVRGWGLDAEFGGDLHVTGTLDTPQVNGALNLQRGRFEEFNKRFTLEQAYLRFQGAVPPSPYLDIRAVTQAEGVQAAVLLTGPVSKPKIDLDSVPALPQDEILSRILFDRTISRISPFEAVQLAQTLQRLAGQGGGGFNAMDSLRSLTGLNDIRVDRNAEGETSVGAGKYLTEKVYLEVESGSSEASGAATVEIELTPSVSVESKIGQGSKSGAGIFWKRDY